MSRSRKPPTRRVHHNQFEADENGEKQLVGTILLKHKLSGRSQAKAKSKLKRITHRNGRRVSKQVLTSGAKTRTGKLGYRRPDTRLDLGKDR